MKFINLSSMNPTSPFGAYVRTCSTEICIARTPTPRPPPYLNPHHRFSAYPRTLNSAIYLTRTSTSTPIPTTYLNHNHTRLVRTLEPEVQQFVSQVPQPQPERGRGGEGYCWSEKRWERVIIEKSS